MARDKMPTAFCKLIYIALTNDFPPLFYVSVREEYDVSEFLVSL